MGRNARIKLDSSNCGQALQTLSTLNLVHFDRIEHRFVALKRILVDRHFQPYPWTVSRHSQDLLPGFAPYDPCDKRKGQIRHGAPSQVLLFFVTRKLLSGLAQSCNLSNCFVSLRAQLCFTVSSVHKFPIQISVSERHEDYGYALYHSNTSHSHLN